MALPTLKPYFTTRGGGCTARLQRIAERDTFEKERRQTFSNHSQYFKASRVASQKAKEWTSEQALKTRLGGARILQTVLLPTNIIIPGCVH